MGKKATPGLYKRGKYWHIKKTICGVNIYESTRTASLVDAELYLAKRVKEVLNYIQFGERPKKIFAEGAARYIIENKEKPSVKDDSTHLKKLMQFIGDTELEKINNQILQPFIESRKEEGVKNKTINLALSVVRRILNLAASDWVDEQGKTWITYPAKIKMLPLDDKRKPYPISVEEQELLFSYLSPHLLDMCLFKVNTGTRDQEVCSLQWDWEVKIPSLDTFVFVIPAHLVKNRRDRLVIVNDTAKEVVNNRS
jgi:site-specific recombinase XerD